MTIRNVPGAPVACGDATLTDCLAFCCFPEHGLLDALHGGEDGGVGLAFLDDEPVADLVGFGHVLWKFAHESIIGTGGSRSPPLVDTSQFVQHLLHLIVVDGGVVVGETVARLSDTMEHQQIDAVLPGVGTASDAVEELVILQPQGRIPGLPVCPSVECGVGHVFV